MGLAGQPQRTCRDGERGSGGAKERSGHTPTCQGGEVSMAQVSPQSLWAGPSILCLRGLGLALLVTQQGPSKL